MEEMAVESKTGKRQQVVTDLAKFFEKVFKYILLLLHHV